jgi:ribosomal protein S18 acetylase RimI-like enzyme
MESFQIDNGVGRSFAINVEEAGEVTDSLVRTLIEIDLQTFSESTYSNYTARVFLSSGRVFLLKAEDTIIGTCVCTRSWERPNEALMLTMGIRPGWRGRGLGHRFFKGVATRLEQKGVRAINLLVSRDNRRALRIYQDTGFEIISEMEPDMRTGETFILMRKKLSVSSPVTELPAPDPRG